MISWGRRGSHFQNANGFVRSLYTKRSERRIGRGGWTRFDDFRKRHVLQANLLEKNILQLRKPDLKLSFIFGKIIPTGRQLKEQISSANKIIQPLPPRQKLNAPQQSKVVSRGMRKIKHRQLHNLLLPLR